MPKAAREFFVGFEANVDTASLTRKLRDGKWYLVGPIVMACEGVINRLLYRGSELRKSVPKWNGRPVTAGHPRDEKGSFISANDPEVLSQCQLGDLFHVSYDEKANKLKGQCWINEAKLMKFPTIKAKIDKKEMLEVSTGLFLDREGDAGTFGEEDDEYDAEAVNHAGDHMAILPDEIGACSVADGAGFPRANQKDDAPDVNIYPKTGESKEDFTKRFMSDPGMKKEYPTQAQRYKLCMIYWKKGPKMTGNKKVSQVALGETITVNDSELTVVSKAGKYELVPTQNEAEDSEELFPDNNALTSSVRAAMLSKALSAFFTGNANRAWVEDFTESIVYFSKYNSGTNSYDMFRLSYKINEKETKITFVGDPVPVIRKVAYEDAPDANGKKGTKPMTRKEQVDTLVNSKKFAEGRRAWLEGLPDEEFEAVANACKPEEPKTEAPKTEPKTNKQEETPKTEAPKLSPEVQDAVTFANEQREEIIGSILKANKDVYTREELAAMPLTALRKVHKLVVKETATAPSADRTGVGGPGGTPPAANASGIDTEAPLVTPPMYETKKEEKA